MWIHRVIRGRDDGAGSARSFAAVCVITTALLGAPAARAAQGDDEPIDSEAGIGIAAGLVSLVYTPAKVLYALGGGVAAGMAYLASAGDQDVTEPILTPSLRGDYVVTPEHLRGERPLEFFGRAPGDPAHHRSDPPAVSSGDGLDGTSASASASRASAPAEAGAPLTSE